VTVRLKPAALLRAALGRSTRDAHSAVSPVGAVQRAAALLRGGMPSGRVWRVLVEQAGSDTPQWRILTAAWTLAHESGAPLAETLDRLEGALRSLAKLAERRSVLLAGPRATIRLVTALPPLAAALGTALGFDPLPALRSPLGWAALVSGGLLMALGIRWSRGMARRVAEADWVAGWEFELTAIALGGGAPPREALRHVVECIDGARAEWVRIEELGPGGAVPRAIAEAGSLGAPLRPMLLGEARACRDRAQAELEGAAERLGVKVLVPLGVCVLPAFILLGVVPVLLAVLGGAGL